MIDKQKLYTFLPDIEYPSVLRFDEKTGGILCNVDKREGVYLFKWPDDQTCFPVEMYLSDLADTKTIKKSDGGTVGAYARDLSHLARYCYKQNTQFWELTTAHIDQLLAELVRELDSRGERVRTNNTIKQNILPKIVSFLKWLQLVHFPTQNIIGVDTTQQRFQIKLSKAKKIGRSGRSYGEVEVFPTNLPTSTSLAKAPIASVTIKSMWDTLNDTKGDMRLNDRLLHLFDASAQKDHLAYMYHRRRFQLLLLESTGLRPQELINIRFSTNQALITNSKLEIPTLKRGDIYYRQVPLERGVAIKVEMFMLVHRRKLIDRLLKYGLISNENEVDDVLYLNSESGKKVSPDAAYQEFKRISHRAGIEVKNCQTMFRCRFATNMVKIHFTSFIDKNPIKNKYNFAENDYRTILKKVATFTGHKDPESLWHYIDLAWEELEVFSYAYEVKNLQSRLHSITKLVSDVKAGIKLTDNYADTIQVVVQGLNEIESEADLMTNNK